MKARYGNELCPLGRWDLTRTTAEMRAFLRFLCRCKNLGGGDRTDHDRIVLRAVILGIHFVQDPVSVHTRGDAPLVGFWMSIMHLLGQRCEALWVQHMLPHLRTKLQARHRL